MTYRPQPISDRIAAWKQAYDAVLAEVAGNQALAPRGAVTGRVMNEQWQTELAARTAATLAIGATTRERGE